MSDEAGREPIPYEPYDGGLSEEQRDDIVDLLQLHRVAIWGDESELDRGLFGRDWTLAKWLDAIGHPKSHPGCCGTCGCAITCMGGLFEQSLTDTILRELNRHGLLRAPTEDS